jgi:hypothetical protein
VLGLVAVACQSPPDPAAEPISADVEVVPKYNERDGRLEELAFGADPAAVPEGRAFMDGARIERAEIDTDLDGRPDRFEYYAPAGTGAPAGAQNVLVRVEQAGGPNGAVTRWEYYERGVIARVEEDANKDGRVDKWERYVNGVLASVDLDLSHSGRPERRLVYAPDGSVERIEVIAP